MENINFILSIIDLILSIYIIILLKRLEKKNKSISYNSETEISDGLHEYFNSLANVYAEDEENYTSSKAEFIENMKEYIANSFVNSESEYYSEIANLDNFELKNLIASNLEQYIYENINAIYNEIYEKKMANTNIIMNKITENVPNALENSDKSDTINIIDDLFNMSK